MKLSFYFIPHTCLFCPVLNSLFCTSLCHFDLFNLKGRFDQLMSWTTQGLVLFDGCLVRWCSSMSRSEYFCRLEYNACSSSWGPSCLVISHRSTLFLLLEKQLSCNVIKKASYWLFLFVIMPLLCVGLITLQRFVLSCTLSYHATCPLFHLVQKVMHINIIKK